MDPCSVEKTVSRMADYLAARNDLRGLAAVAPDRDLGDLGRASIVLVNEVAAKILLRHGRHEAHLADLIDKLDAEDKRGTQLEERINQASNTVVQAELWLARVTEAIETKFAFLNEPEAGMVVAP